MKKLLIVVLVALALLCALSALAEGTVIVEEYDLPVNPQRVRANRIAYLPNDVRMYLSGDLAVSLSEPTGDYFEEGLTWTAQATGGDGNYQYYFQLIGLEEQFGDRRVHGYQDYSESNTFSYLFVVPGSYSLRCWVEDGNGHTSYGRYDLEIVDSERPTTAQIVSQIVAECRDAGVTGDYDTALWLHDWITHHACYDYSYTYYSADGVLVRGTGVCDSYSKAYQLLLNEAGIWADGVTNANHAWNIAKLDGKYYQIDPTWDDPGESTDPVSGKEWYIYFCLPDELMRLDHAYSPSIPCVSYDANYYIHTGQVNTWIDEPGLLESHFVADFTISDRISAGLTAYQLRYQVAVPEYYAKGNGSYSHNEEPIVYGLSAYALSQRDWPVDDRTMRLSVSYSSEDRQMTASVQLDDTALRLPDSLVTVESESFANDSGFMAVEIPEGARSIGAHAFAGCENLWKVVIPDSVEDIDPSAFANSPHVNIVCGPESAAAAFASENGIHCVLE
ncbi:MAG: leucine-rich repeat protein [Clostridia bacterium]|nr:leucine-rich repeat protein [Clostridia bacterium]